MEKNRVQPDAKQRDGNKGSHMTPSFPKKISDKSMKSLAQINSDVLLKHPDNYDIILSQIEVKNKLNGANRSQKRTADTKVFHDSKAIRHSPSKNKHKYQLEKLYEPKDKATIFDDQRQPTMDSARKHIKTLSPFRIPNAGRASEQSKYHRMDTIFRSDESKLISSLYQDDMN